MARVKRKAEELKIPAVVVIFEPQPEEFFSNNKLLRITSLREKLRLFAEYSVDYVLVLPFNSRFFTINAVKFIENILLDKLHIKYLVVGDDFSFGYKHVGDFLLLEHFAKRYRFVVEQQAAFKLEDVRVSSSYIRKALLHGDIALTEQFLGRPYKVSGLVIHGNHVGRRLGFPTANIYLKKHEIPLAGVYAVRVYGVDPDVLYGVVNIGFCPTFLRTGKSFEVYIFNFSENIYGKKIAVEFIGKIREEKKFDSFVNLAKQIEEDLKEAQKILRMG